MRIPILHCVNSTVSCVPFPNPRKAIEQEVPLLMAAETPLPQSSPWSVKHWMLIFVIALIVCMSIYLNVSRLLNHDSAWYAYAIQKMHEGKVLYVDIMEVNPPLFFWLSYPSIVFKKFWSLNYTYSFKVWHVLISFFSWLFGIIIVRKLHSDRQFILIVALGLAVVLLLFPSWDFAQREHLALVLGMPYIVLQALRRLQTPVPLPISLIAGVLAGLGFGLKPYILIVPLVLELYVQWGRWRLRRVFRPENLTLAMTLTVYVMAVFLFAPAYFSHLLPLALATYSTGHETTWGEFLKVYLSPIRNSRFHIFFYPASAILIYLQIRQSPPAHERTLVFTLLVAALGFELSWILQGKIWVYLAYPPMALLMLATIVTLKGYFLPEKAITKRFDIKRAMRFSLFAMMSLPLAMAIYISYADSYTAYLHLQRSTGLFTSDVRRFYIFTTRLSSAFPLVNILDKEWASRYPHLWPLPAIIKARRENRMTPELEKAEKFLFQSLLDDLERYRPELILVHTAPELFIGSFDYVKYFSRDPRFAAFMERYKIVHRNDVFAYYRQAETRQSDAR